MSCNWRNLSVLTPARKYSRFPHSRNSNKPQITVFSESEFAWPRNEMQALGNYLKRASFTGTEEIWKSPGSSSRSAMSVVSAVVCLVPYFWPPRFSGSLFELDGPLHLVVHSTGHLAVPWLPSALRVLTCKFASAFSSWAEVYFIAVSVSQQFAAQVLSFTSFQCEKLVLKS